MKNFILPVLALLFAVSYAGAEVIDSVMYNPARLGQYEKLKVSDKASFKGGVKANTLTLQSAGTVTVNNAGDYQVQNADVKGTVNMPSTHFVAPSIKTQGGTARFVQTGETSSIDTINSVLPRLKANILKMNAVTVNGTPGTDYDNDSIKGLKLGGNDIPAPSVNCSGLNWFARVDRNSGLTYRVLGLGACEGGEPEQEQDCTQNPNQEKCCTGGREWNGSTCVCPSGQTWNGFSCGQSQCSGGSTRACGCNNKGTQTRTCNAGTWSDWSTCTAKPCEYRFHSTGIWCDNGDVNMSYGYLIGQASMVGTECYKPTQVNSAGVVVSGAAFVAFDNGKNCSLCGGFIGMCMCGARYHCIDPN